MSSRLMFLMEPNSSFSATSLTGINWMPSIEELAHEQVGEGVGVVLQPQLFKVEITHRNSHCHCHIRSRRAAPTITTLRAKALRQ